MKARAVETRRSQRDFMGGFRPYLVGGLKNLSLFLRIMLFPGEAYQSGESRTEEKQSGWLRDAYYHMDVVNNVVVSRRKRLVWLNDDSRDLSS